MSASSSAYTPRLLPSLGTYTLGSVMIAPSDPPPSAGHGPRVFGAFGGLGKSAGSAVGPGTFPDSSGVPSLRACTRTNCDSFTNTVSTRRVPPMTETLRIVSLTPATTSVTMRSKRSAGFT